MKKHSLFFFLLLFSFSIHAANGQLELQMGSGKIELIDSNDGVITAPGSCIGYEGLTKIFYTPSMPKHIAIHTGQSFNLFPLNLFLFMTEGWRRNILGNDPALDPTVESLRTFFLGLNTVECPLKKACNMAFLLSFAYTIKEQQDNKVSAVQFHQKWKDTLVEILTDEQ